MVSVRQEAVIEEGQGRRAVFDDLVRRNFTADAPNKLWLTDITEHWTDECKLYLVRDNGPSLQPERRPRSCSQVSCRLVS